MTSYQNALDYVTDQISQGKMTASQANVKIIQMMGVRVIKGKIIRQVRKDLNDAVKSGELGRLPKKGLKPEIYFHKNSRAKAIEEQNRIEKELIEILKKTTI